MEPNEHGADQFPHEGGCHICQKLQQCNACGVSIAGFVGIHCTNGRCANCHPKFCTDGGSTSPGHGFWRKGTKPRHLRTRTTAMKHTIEELGDFAEDNSDGAVHIWKIARHARGEVEQPWGPRTWGARIGSDSISKTHYGATPDQAIDKAIDAHERRQNPDSDDSA